MKIIKNGKELMKKNTFTCDKCDCIFEADDNEVKKLGRLAAIHDGISFRVKCPWCGADVYR